MLPRWHVFWGAVFTAVLWYFARVDWIYLSLVFLSSVFIDLDHYICGAMRTRTLHFGQILDYHKKMGKIQKTERDNGIRKRGDFHLFHTIEFHILVASIGLFWIPFFYIFIGLVFHSLLDLFYLMNKNYVYRREYFFFRWVSKRFEF